MSLLKNMLLASVQDEIDALQETILISVDRCSELDDEGCESIGYRVKRLRDVKQIYKAISDGAHLTHVQQQRLYSILYLAMSEE
jgi:hypothetical protein